MVEPFSSWKSRDHLCLLEAAIPSITLLNDLYLTEFKLIKEQTDYLIKNINSNVLNVDLIIISYFWQFCLLFCILYVSFFFCQVWNMRNKNKFYIFVILQYVYCIIKTFQIVETQFWADENKTSFFVSLFLFLYFFNSSFSWCWRSLFFCQWIQLNHMP